MTPEILKVALGKYFRQYEMVDDYTQIIDVSKIIIQPLYQDAVGNYASDIAILILQNIVHFSPSVSPVCIDWDLDSMANHLALNSIGFSVGVGITENNTFSDRLRAVSLSVIDDQSCIQNQTRDFKKYVTYTTFCAGWGNGTGVCNGDSGGGLVFPRFDNGTQWVLQGIVSVSPKRRDTSFCNSEYFTIFTKVGMYMDWIKRTLNSVNSNETLDIIF